MSEQIFVISDGEFTRMDFEIFLSCTMQTGIYTSDVSAAEVKKLFIKYFKFLLPDSKAKIIKQLEMLLVANKKMLGDEKEDWASLWNMLTAAP